ncbi:hypothetical protein LOTGIDRAFT_159859 [Lottia gigantea]|uniref:Amine oxidase n=1 Tax=Lottia gigantea TaxID=225164 RepID=V3ZY47_LOTGI|nr:hypothetical protein LOTGIDRAFT_159859 [Lottia gigantea]ESO96448.1 hypothetical protein LOTGIDRAFT_159859 [Lottia gigantea]
MAEETNFSADQSRKATRWRCISALLFVLCVLLAIVAVAILVIKNNELKNYKQNSVGVCGAKIKSSIDTSEPDDPTIFHGLTGQELQSIQEYMKSVPELNIETGTLKLNSSYIIGIDYIVPPKSEVLDYLDSGGPKPARSALVIMLRGDLNPPLVEEYQVQPLPNPTNYELIKYKNRPNPIPFEFRPFTAVEFKSIFDILLKQVDDELGDLLQESYGATFHNCGDRCLYFCPNVASSAVTGRQTRMMWMQVTYAVEFYTVHPVDLMLYMNLTGSNFTQFKIEKVVYNRQYRNSLKELADDYAASKVKKSKFRFPEENEKLFSTLHRRGSPAQPGQDQRPPRLIEPDGPRYTIKHRYIEYMNWKFHVRMATYKGPQIHDVRFAGDRIAYEIGLQEIAAFYSADAPTFRMAQYVDSVASIGTKAKALVPGVDCPETAAYMSTWQVEENEKGYSRAERSFCVFELNTGYPLRRHHEFYAFRGGFYGGMADSCLVVRSVMTLNNYDYVMDFIFHQSGIMETKIISTGYIYGGVYHPNEAQYGFEINEGLHGTLHHHLFHFKADLDIKGTMNRYETLDIKPINVSNSKWLDGLNTVQTQIKFDPVLKTSEKKAAYKFNFNTPKEHVFHNELHKNSKRESRAYKIQLSGMSKQLLPEDKLNERTISWARYQLAVTKHKDDEHTSSSIYSSFDALDPIVKFADFIEDDENLIDEDLVTWVSLGMIHIPISEDLPLTQTPGKHLSFLLSPHNYFTEDPSMSSRDQVRVEYKDKDKPKDGVRVTRYFESPEAQCVGRDFDFDADVKENPENILDV